MVPSSFFLAPTWFFWICSATQELHHIDASLIRASNIDCGGQHRVACDTLQSTGVGADRTVHGFLLLPETKSHWEAFPVGLLLSQHSTSVRDSSTNRIVVIAFGLILIGVLAYWLSHHEWPDEHDHDEGQYSNSSPWEEAYQNAIGVQRDSFDLLFRTGIVPKIDRSSEVVNRGHIERCVQVAEEMLREKPLNVWLGQSENTRRVFENRLADSYKMPLTPTSSMCVTPKAPMQDHLAAPYSSPLLQERSPTLNAYRDPIPPRVTPREASQCTCGTIFGDDSMFCSRCGAKRPEDAITAIFRTRDAVEETPLNKFMGDDEFSSGHLRGTPAFATVANLPQGESRPASKENMPTEKPFSASFASIDTVSTVAAVDCGKKSSPILSPASTVPVVDAEKKKTLPDEGRQKFQILPGSLPSTSMPTTVPILEEQPEGRTASPQTSPPQTRTRNPRGNESEGWPVVMKFPSKPTTAGSPRTGSWETSASRSLEQKLNKPE